MVKNIELEQLVINKLTQEQFDNIEVKNPDELYFVTDAENDGGKGAQVEEMPEATEMNAGQIVQYVGETIPDIEATATITQTVGDSLTDLKVDAKKFEKASGLTEAGSLEFVFEIIKDNAILGEQVGTFSCSFDSDKFISNLISTWGENWWEVTGGTDMFLVYANNNMWGLSNSVPLLEETMGSQVCAWLAVTGDWGFYVSDDSQVANNDYIPVSVVLGSTKLLQDTNEILPSNYGITYSGTPSNGDTLKVDYTPFVGGYEKGYFYVNQAQLSEPTVTIEQTVGNSLSNLSVDVDKFIEAEQPVGDCDVKFTVAEAAENTHTTYVTQSGDVSFSGNISKLLKAKGLEHILPNGGVIVCGTNINSVDDFYIGPELGFSDLVISINELEEYGIHFDGTYLVGAYATWSYDESTDVFVPGWTKDSNNVELKQYGISYSGRPSTGDTITVNYITPQIKDYNWNQINVQPASKGNGGIEWAAKLDLPADYPEQYAWECYPIWTIPGGIPDGTYEFYIQTLCGTDAATVLAGIQNYTCKIKVKFYTENSTRRYIGSISYVLDGSCTGDGNLRVVDDTRYFANVFKIINDTDLCFYSSLRPFASSALGYVTLTQAIPEIFKITAFKNIHTGELYYPQGQIYDGTNRPTTYTNIYGELALEAFSNPISYPYYFNTRDFTINKNLKHICMSPQMLSRGNNYSAFAGKITIYIESDTGGKFSAIIDNKNPSKSMIYGLESTGDLSDVQIGTGSQTSYTYINLNPQNKQFQRITVCVALTSPSNTQQSVDLWYADGMQALDTFTPYTITKVSGDIDTTNIGTILQYTHETTEDYTQGYFYKAVGETSIAPASVDVTYIGQEGIQITVNDPGALIEKLSQLSGWDKNSIIEYINYGWYWWQYTENYIQWDLFGTFYDAELVNCFTVTPVENLDNGILTFNLGNFSPSREIITNGRWEQVNVQPASNTVQVTEMPEASEKNVGKILQYIGTPTSEYDQGYFYKSVVVSQDGISISASIMEGEPYADELSVSIDSEKLIDVISKELGLSSGLYRIAFSVSMGLTMLGKLNTDGKVEKSVTFNGVQTLESLYEELGITLTLTEDGSAPDLSNYDAVRIDIVYSDSQAICEWRQVNVQPSSGGGGEAPSELPNLTGNEGRFLSNNGSELEWVDAPNEIPDITGNEGKLLSNNGTEIEWIDTPTSLPAQEGHSGKFLTTDGANLSWADVSSGGGTVSGDYLPLSGGTLTGPLKFENAMGFSGGVTLKAENWGAYGGDRFFIENAVLVVNGVRPSTSGLVQLGACKEPENQIYPEGEFFSRVCTKALNNGTYQDDIIIPEKSGTLALIEDIEAVMGDLSSALDTINGEEI